MESVEMSLPFWKGKKVFITGHTGFKGSWLSLWLQNLGADLVGFAQPPATCPSLYELARVSMGMGSSYGDIRDAARIRQSMADCRPEIVIHMAAQALVRYAYEHPLETYQTNVMGTAHVLDAARQTDSVRVVVVVTSDKCYENKEWEWAYREPEPLGGYDPYASSKACAELVTAAYRRSFFNRESDGGRRIGIATARAGNVIGGGDWSPERLVPDVMNALLTKQNVALRKLNAVRPWQHVLEPLRGYLMLAERLWLEPESYAEAWNFGPREESNQPVTWIAERLSTLWGGEGSWKPDPRHHPHEDKFLKLDSSKAHGRLGWRPRLDLEAALRWIVEWYREYAMAGADAVRKITEDQIRRYEELDREDGKF